MRPGPAIRGILESNAARASRRALVALLAMVAVGICPAELRSQSLNGNRAAIAVPLAADSSNDQPGNSEVPDFGRRQSLRGLASVASFIVPGSGQFLLRNDRFVAYVAVELLSWLQYSKDIAERAAQERAYKDLARRVARVNLSTTLPDADWLYYEWMRDFKESGQFSLSSSGPTVPETDVTTYNGNRWVIASGTQPTYEAALAQYEREAIRPEYRWSWKNAQLQYDVYKRMTDKRNDAARAAVKDLLVVGANHFLSMVDAFATLRMQVRTELDGRATVGASLRW